jgi:hypothetical protein
MMTAWHIDLGAEVLDRRTGRVGRATQVTRENVFVRFAEGEKSKYLPRERLVPLSVVRAMAEVDEDEANAAAYRAARR